MELIQAFESQVTVLVTEIDCVEAVPFRCVLWPLLSQANL